MTFDGNWLIMDISKGTSPVNKTWIAKVEGGALPADGTHLRYLVNLAELEWIKIKDDFDSGLSSIASNGNVFCFESNLDAPKKKIVRYDLDHPVSPIKLSRLIFRNKDSSLSYLNNAMQFSKMPPLRMKNIYFYNTCTTFKASCLSSPSTLWNALMAFTKVTFAPMASSNPLPRD